MLGVSFDLNFTSEDRLHKEFAYQSNWHFKGIVETLPLNAVSALRSRVGIFGNKSARSDLLSWPMQQICDWNIGQSLKRERVKGSRAKSCLCKFPISGRHCCCTFSAWPKPVGTKGCFSLWLWANVPGLVNAVHLQLQLSGCQRLSNFHDTVSTEFALRFCSFDQASKASRADLKGS